MRSKLNAPCVYSITLAAAFINIRRLKIANSNKFNCLIWCRRELWSRVSGRATHNRTSQRGDPSWWNALFPCSIPLTIARSQTWGLLWMRLLMSEDLRLQAQLSSAVSFGFAENCEKVSGRASHWSYMDCQRCLREQIRPFCYLRRLSRCSRLEALLSLERASPSVK
jgi:hypothetical protein